MKIYISGPISGYDLSERKTAFGEVQKKLEKQGYRVLNPMKNGLPENSTTREHMRADIKMLCECDYIYFMNRWTHSAGCQLEFRVAQALGCGMIFQTYDKEIREDIIYRFD